MKKTLWCGFTTPWHPPRLALWPLFQEAFGAAQPALPKRRGRRPRVPFSKGLPALVFHVMNAAGTLAEHFAQRFEDSLCESSLSERRTRLPWEVFPELMPLCLRPLA